MSRQVWSHLSLFPAAVKGSRSEPYRRLLANSPPSANNLPSLWARRAYTEIKGLVTTYRADPAAKSNWEVILAYPGFHAVLLHKLSSRFYHRRMYCTARVISHLARLLTGIEIHPGAKIGKRMFIDHGFGVVIGETAEVGDDVLLYQGVTLGATGKELGKRHPTVGDRVIVGAGASILGNLTLGNDSRVGAGAVIVQSVPAGATAVGIPGKVVKMRDQMSDAEHVSRVE
jgi:serine O-acetyltransferase